MPKYIQISESKLIQAFYDNQKYENKSIFDLIKTLEGYGLDKIKLNNLIDSYWALDKTYVSNASPEENNRAALSISYRILGLWRDIFSTCEERFLISYCQGYIPFDKQSVIETLDSILFSGKVLLSNELYKHEIDWKTNELYQQTLMEDLLRTINDVPFGGNPKSKHIFLACLPEDFIVLLENLKSELLIMQDELGKALASQMN